MKVLKEIILPMSFTWLFFVFVIISLIIYNWKRRWLYYYGSKIDGPPSWPLIGSALCFKEGYNMLYENLLKVCQTYQPVFKMWIGGQLFIVDSKPENIEIILNTFLEKPQIYSYGYVLFRDGLLTGPVSIWRRHRKIINTTFHPKILNSYVKVFEKHAKILVRNLREKNHGEPMDISTKLWRSTLDTACDALLDVDPNKITGKDDYIKTIERITLYNANRLENYASRWVFSPWFILDLFINLSKIFQYLPLQVFDFVKNVVKLKKIDKLVNSELDNQKFLCKDDDLRNKRFLNYLMDLTNANSSFTENDIFDETQNLLIAGSETTAIAISYVLLVVGIYQDVQNKIYQELFSIFGECERDTTLEDLNRMEYLERVIKETMRLLPVSPGIIRHVDRDIKIDSYVYPKGSSVMIPFMYLFRKPELWKDPLVFDPDRFLPKENEKRHRCTYIPFSYGVRNCIGLKYGMLSMKMMLSVILKHFQIYSVDHKSIEDIKVTFNILTKPKDGCKVILKRRNKFYL